MPNDKHQQATLKAKALSQMYTIVSSDWAKLSVLHKFKDTGARGMAINAQTILDIIVEDELKDLYETLKQYYA